MLRLHRCLLRRALASRYLATDASRGRGSAAIITGPDSEYG